MRVLVDTSVWSLSLRRRGPVEHAQVEKLARLIRSRDDVAITGTILQEVLQTFREDASFAQIQARLAPFTFLHLDRAAYIGAARLHRSCAARGVTVSTADCQIAIAATSHGYSLLTADSDFDRIAAVCDLELV